MNNVLTSFAPSAHRIQEGGIGYSRPLTDDELRKVAPSIFAEQPHDSRSQRYAYIPTTQIITAMRSEGFFPVRVIQSKSRDTTKQAFTKHLIRFRRDDQLQAAEAREVVLVNSHDGSSALELMAGMFRLVCSNGLVVGKKDTEIKVRHSGRLTDDVIEGAYRVVKDFDQVTESVEAMKALPLKPEQQLAFAKAALSLRFDDPDNCGIAPSQILRPKRMEDKAGDLWTTFNVAQEHLIKGGDVGRKVTGDGKRKRVTTRTINGIDQSVGINRGLWVLAEEMRKLAA